jgi:hypothetical protein
VGSGRRLWFFDHRTHSTSGVTRIPRILFFFSRMRAVLCEYASAEDMSHSFQEYLVK